MAASFSKFAYFRESNKDIKNSQMPSCKNVYPSIKSVRLFIEATVLKFNQRYLTFSAYNKGHYDKILQKYLKKIKFGNSRASKPISCYVVQSRWAKRKKKLFETISLLVHKLMGEPCIREDEALEDFIVVCRTLWLN